MSSVLGNMKHHSENLKTRVFFTRTDTLGKDVIIKAKEIQNVEMKIIILKPNNSPIFIPNVETEVNPRIMNGKVKAIVLAVSYSFSYLK